MVLKKGTSCKGHVSWRQFLQAWSRHYCVLILKQTMNIYKNGADLFKTVPEKDLLWYELPEKDPFIIRQYLNTIHCFKDLFLKVIHFDKAVPEKDPSPLIKNSSWKGSELRGATNLFFLRTKHEYIPLLEEHFHWWNPYLCELLNHWTLKTTRPLLLHNCKLSIFCNGVSSIVQV